MGKTQVVAWVEMRIPVVLGDHPVEEEHGELRQPLRLQAAF